jgi:hypothetical protein
MEFTSCMFTSKVNICPFLSPFTINLPWLFMSLTKYPFRLNVTYETLFHHLAYGDQFFCYGWNMKYIFHVLCLPILHGQWHLANLCDGMCSVITSFHKPCCLQILYVSKPFSMTSHVVWSFRIHISDIVIWYIFYH